MGEIDGSNGGDTVPGAESIGGCISELSLYAMAIEFEMKQQFLYQYQGTQISMS